MPVFEYRCEGCGKKFEKLIKGRERVSCPDCGARKVTRLFSTFGVKSGDRFTGSAGSCSSCSASTCGNCRG